MRTIVENMAPTAGRSTRLQRRSYPGWLLSASLKKTILDAVRALAYSDPEESSPKAGNQFPKPIKSCRTLNCRKNVKIECCLNTISWRRWVQSLHVFLYTLSWARITILWVWRKNIYLSVSTPVVMRPKSVHFNFKRDDERACLDVSFLLLWQNCDFDLKKLSVLRNLT